MKLKPRYDGRDDWLDNNYASLLVGMPAFAHPVFAILNLICLVLLLCCRRPADVAVAGLLGSTLLYALSFFVLSVACEYRYLYAIDLSAITASFYLLSDWRPRAYFATANATTSSPRLVLDFACPPAAITTRRFDEPKVLKECGIRHPERSQETVTQSCLSARVTLLHWPPIR